jgi:putative phosphoribosyl transferase
VVLVDDGLATGVTARAACAAMKASNAAAVMLAVPVGSAHTVTELQQQQVADVVVCLRTPKRFRAVGAHYLVRPAWLMPPLPLVWLHPAVSD